MGTFLSSSVVSSTRTALLSSPSFSRRGYSWGGEGITGSSCASFPSFSLSQCTVCQTLVFWLFSFTVSHRVCLPDQNNPFIPGIQQEEGKAWLSYRQFMHRSQPAEVWEIINCREMDSGRKMVDSQRFLVDRCINISTALSTIGSGEPKACNNSYTVQWTKVQKVIRNEIKVSTGYKTSIQTRSRKIIEMIVRLQKNDKKRQGEEYKELWMRCKINGKTFHIHKGTRDGTRGGMRDRRANILLEGLTM